MKIVSDKMREWSGEAVFLNRDSKKILVSRTTF